jgi:short-subunit dehydrogenase involved in D-alanine esterification of teichoic acids
MSSMFRNGLLSGKRILVSGGGSGIGKELAAEYLRLGAEVHVCGRRKGVLDETASELRTTQGGRLRLAQSSIAQSRAACVQSNKNP